MGFPYGSPEHLLAHPTAPPGKGMSARLRVLIVGDDDPEVERLLDELRKSGLQVDACRAESDARFQSLLEPSTDLILAACEIEGFDVLNALAYLRSEELDIPFIAITASFDQHVADCIKLGADDYVLKDQFAYLGPAVHRALEHKLLREAKRRAELDLRDSERRLRVLVEHGAQAIIVVSLDGMILDAVSSVERILGYSVQDLTGHSLLELAHAENQHSMHRMLTELGRAPKTLLSGQFQLRHKNGSWRHLEVVATNLLHEPCVAGIVINAHDVSERVALEEQLQRRALYDPLTGLPSRVLFMDRLEHCLRTAARQSSGVGVLFLDLDGFKLINDSLGHGAGDQLLTAVGRRLADTIRPGDTLARFGGDEFTVLLDDVASPAKASHIASRLLEALSTPFVLQRQERFIAASIGVVWSGPQAEPRQPEDLLREADVALYQAKAAGKGRMVIYKASMSLRAVERLNLETELRQALDHHELHIEYQPIVELSTGRVVGLEALARWTHPRRGPISPSLFIPIAEESGLIVPLGRWVLGEACRQAQDLASISPGSAPLTVAINVSARQLQQPDFVDQVAQALAEHRLNPKLLEIEVTESTAMDQPSATATNLHALKSLGVKLAIDDFGTGYSSLSYLQRFPVDTLKVDGSFIARLGHDQESTAVVRAVVALAQALGVAVTAEGAETGEQLSLLRELGCTFAQGFYFSKPLPEDEIRLTGQPWRHSLKR